MNLRKVLISISILLAITVIALGSYTRLTNAGLGCPDWPGCYGHATVAQIKTETISNLNIDTTKAWTEMVHRYFAGSLALLVFAISFMNFYNRKNIKVSILLICTIIFQALLGMWTVTWKLLPTVVMGHLLGGFLTLSLLWLLLLDSEKFKFQYNIPKNTKILSFIALITISLQIMLGGWTSSNYAALPCLDFPTCNNHLLPNMELMKNFSTAFNPFHTIGPNYDGGLLDYSSRVLIQLVHRFGAYVNLIIILAIVISNYINKNYFKLNAILLSLLILQITLGILNVKLFLPVFVAVSHTTIGVLLLLVMIALNYFNLSTKVNLTK